MWNDIETTTDYLNFSVTSKTVADLIIESDTNPISIGVSGSWGSGKSSMVKMIGKELMQTAENDSDSSFVFINFNAWLYQGYDDAKSALLHVVAKKLSDEIEKTQSEDKESLNKKLASFVKRINWFHVSNAALPLLLGLIPGVAPAGALVSMFGAMANAITDAATQKKDDAEKASETLEKISPEISALVKGESLKPATEQIQEMRNEFEEILNKLNIKLVVLVDDLDRCLPETSVATLEAMRLLLFVKRTSFIIAADEEMIRKGVSAHFGDVELSDGLVTSYFDKLIQIPITVPHLGIAEIKVYIVLLFLESEVKKGKIDSNIFDDAQIKLNELLSKSWDENVSESSLSSVFESDSLKIMKEYISIADQLSGILVTADNIKGNPRLIKRFLNALEIRKKVAALNGMTLDSGILIKMLLFERCASKGAFDYLAKEVSMSENGKPEFIKTLENKIIDSEKYDVPNSTWENDFVKKWLLLTPKLSDYDLRPLFYLSRDRTMPFATFDDLSPEGAKILEALNEIKNGTISKELVEKLQDVGEKEATIILKRILSLGRSNQWEMDTVYAALHVTDAFPELGSDFIMALSEIPANSRNAACVPALYDKEWATNMLDMWAEDPQSPAPVKNAIKQKKGGK